MMIDLILAAFAPGLEPWLAPDWVAVTHEIRDGREYDTRLHFSPPKPRTDGYYDSFNVRLECEVRDLASGKWTVHRAEGGILMRQDALGADLEELGTIQFWLPGFGGHPDGFVKYDDPRCASGVPDIGVDD
jgi:hypothetical protein